MSRRPPTQVIEAIAKIGQDIRYARLRRRISVEDLSTHASISRTTLHKVERGDPTVAINTYGTVLYILSKPTLKRFADVIDSTVDPFRDQHLPKRVRLKHRMPPE